MVKKYTDLLEWFNRNRSPDVDIEPVPVTRERALAARNFLRKHSGIDFDSFHEGAKVDVLLNQALGPTSDCLTAEGISRFICSHALVPLQSVDTSIVMHAIRHASVCKDCWSNIEIYQMLEQQSLLRARSEGAKQLTRAMWIDPIGEIKQTGAEAVSCLEVSVLMHAEQPLEAISREGMILKVTYPFESDELQLKPVGTTVLPTTKFRRILGLRSYDNFARGRYQTDKIRALSKMEIGSCGYVTISQEIEGEQVESTQLIRFERT